MTIPLTSPSTEHGIAVERSGSDVLVRSADGALCLRVTQGPDELVVECIAGRMRLRAQAAMQIEAPQVSIYAQDELSLQSGGDLHLQARGRVSMRADALSLEAVGGDARIVANDDVRIEGERIRMNS